jgi:hypothetical protein
VCGIEPEGSNPSSSRFPHCLPLAYMELHFNGDTRRQRGNVPSFNADERIENRVYNENLPQTRQTPVKRDLNSHPADAPVYRCTDDGGIARRVSTEWPSNGTTNGASSEYGLQSGTNDYWRAQGEGGPMFSSASAAAASVEPQAGTNRIQSHLANHPEQFARSDTRDYRYCNWNAARNGNVVRPQVEGVPPGALLQEYPGSSNAHGRVHSGQSSFAFACANMNMGQRTVQGLHQQPQQMSSGTDAWRPSPGNFGCHVPNAPGQQSVYHGFQQPDPCLASSGTSWRHPVPGQMLTDTTGQTANFVQRNPADGYPLSSMSNVVVSAGEPRVSVDARNDFVAGNTGLPVSVGANFTRPWYSASSVSRGYSGNIWRAAGLPVDSDQISRHSVANDVLHNRRSVAGSNEAPVAAAGRQYRESMRQESFHSAPPRLIGMAASDGSLGQLNCIAPYAASFASAYRATNRHPTVQESSARHAATGSIGDGAAANSGGVDEGISVPLWSASRRAVDETFEAVNEMRDLFALMDVWLEAIRTSARGEAEAGQRSQSLIIAETHLEDLHRYACSTEDTRNAYRHLDVQRQRHPEPFANIDWNFLGRLHPEVMLKRTAFRLVTANVMASLVNTLALAEAVIRNASVLRDCIHSVICAMSELVSFLDPRKQAVASTGVHVAMNRGSEGSMAPLSGHMARRNSTDSGVSNSSPPVDDILPFGDRCLDGALTHDGLRDTSADSLRLDVKPNNEAVSEVVRRGGACAQKGGLPILVVPDDLSDGSSTLRVELKATDVEKNLHRVEDDDDAESVFSITSDCSDGDDGNDVIIASSFKPTIKLEFQDFFGDSKVLEMAGRRLCPISMASLKREVEPSHSASPVTSHDSVGGEVETRRTSDVDNGRFATSNAKNTVTVPISDGDRTAVVHIGTGATNTMPVNVSKSFVDSMLSMLPSRSCDELVGTSRRSVESRTEGDPDVRDKETVPVQVADGNFVKARQSESNHLLTDTVFGDGCSLEQLINEVIAGDACYSYPESSVGSPAVVDVSYSSADAVAVADPSPMRLCPEIAAATDENDSRYDLNRVKCEGDVSVVVEPYRVAQSMEVSDDLKPLGEGKDLPFGRSQGQPSPRDAISGRRESIDSDLAMSDKGRTVSQSSVPSAGLPFASQNSTEVAAADQALAHRATVRLEAGIIKEAINTGSTDTKNAQRKTMSSVAKFMKTGASSGSKKLRSTLGSVPTKRKIRGKRSAFQAETACGIRKRSEPRPMTASQRILQASYRRSPLTLLNTTQRNAISKKPRSETLPSSDVSNTLSKHQSRPRMQPSGVSSVAGRTLEDPHPQSVEGNCIRVECADCIRFFGVFFWFLFIFWCAFWNLRVTCGLFGKIVTLLLFLSVSLNLRKPTGSTVAS